MLIILFHDALEDSVPSHWRTYVTKLVGECELDPSVNKALDRQQVKVQRSSKDSPTDTFEIEYTEQLKTALDFEKNLKFIIFYNTCS